MYWSKTTARVAFAGDQHPVGALASHRWAYAYTYRSEAERRAALPRWLHTYNHHRGHTALKGSPPASRVPNLTGQYN
jgi:transposase InsO family protein